MTQVTVSSKYQVVIPKEIRQQIHLKTGQRLFAIAKGQVISFLFDRPLPSMRGFLKGMPLRQIREKKDRL